MASCSINAAFENVASGEWPFARSMRPANMSSPATTYSTFALIEPRPGHRRAVMPRATGRCGAHPAGAHPAGAQSHN